MLRMRDPCCLDADHAIRFAEKRIAMRRSCRWPVLALALTAMLLVVPATHAQGDQRCFPETGQCISGRIRTFWEQNGGLAVFGFPIGPQQDALIEGKSVSAQPFERN